MSNGTLASKLEAWAWLRKEANALEAEIKVEVLELKQTLNVDGARATYGSGRRTYDYKSIAVAMGATAAERQAFSKTVVDWKAVCNKIDQAGGNSLEGHKALHHKQARPYASLKLL